MTKKELHPTVVQFKEFVKKNPKIVLEVREGRSSWQELYEDWYLLGEEDSKWESFRSDAQPENKTEEKKTDWMSNIFNSVKRMDPNQVQGYITNLNQALAAIQGVISQFQGSSNPGQKPSNVNQPPSNPFTFKKD
ncbi:YlbD family protein [Bacillus sp. S/N-304-OC-R1]|uniref:YlbD family protein n=1 Tax=Bacillus sp. S/N-304-OC-R1 TaxID=2758034 RepID=UPI001C8EFCDE|nr:YlbD family protein [Bacillus sp. S/N-304-OC-R1]MBY0120825.1 YlbD family protein [Bacillus sp. S/N-304-OC-R1]